MNSAKIHAHLQEHLRLRPLTEEKIPVIVRYKRGRSSVMAVGAPKQEFRLTNSAAHDLSPAEIDQLSNHDDVEMIWYDGKVHITLHQSVPLIEAPAVWDLGTNGSGVTVGVVDTGLDQDHPAFKGMVSTCQDFTGEGNTADGFGHGTHVAGIIAGRTQPYLGVAPGAKLLAAKVLGRDGSGQTSWVMAGLEWCVAHGAQVINLSLGDDTYGDGTDALSVTCDEAVNRGIVVCVAAGNAGPEPKTIGSPGCAKLPITIGASDKQDGLADFSSRGPTADKRTKPDLSFPGVNIVSSRAKGTTMGSPINDSYIAASGTSMATPHASGLCALLLAARPDLKPEQIKTILKQTTLPMPFPENACGAGRGNAYHAFKVAKEWGSIPPTPDPPVKSFWQRLWDWIKDLFHWLFSPVPDVTLTDSIDRNNPPQGGSGVP